MTNSVKKIIAVVIVILLILLGLFFVKDKKGSTSQSGESMSNESISDGESMMSGSLLDLVKAGRTTKCTYSSKDDNMEMTGTTYVSGKNMRTDSEIIMKDGNKMESHMISDGTWMYTWTSALPQGMKIKIEEVESMADDVDTTQPIKGSAAMKDFQNEFDFKCGVWIADSSKFKVPTDVTFTDLSETLKNLNQNGSMCAACDYAPDAESKAQCKKQIGCQ